MKATIEKKLMLEALKQPAPKAPKPITFEAAMVWLRRGTAIRRRAWHKESKIFRVGTDVFVKLPSFYSETPSVWRPYARDFLATDWTKA